MEIYRWMCTRIGGRPSFEGVAVTMWPHALPAEHTQLPDDDERGRGSGGLTAALRRVDEDGLPELHRYWTTRDRAANLRLYRLVAEVLGVIEAEVFHPIVGWQCRECAFRSKCWAWG
jgi:hypothetical protein